MQKNDGNISNNTELSRIDFILSSESKIEITHNKFTISCQKTIKEKLFCRIFNDDELESIYAALSIQKGKKSQRDSPNTIIHSFVKFYEKCKLLKSYLKVLYYYGNPYFKINRTLNIGNGFSEISHEQFLKSLLYQSMNKWKSLNPNPTNDLSIYDTKKFLIQNEEFLIPKLPRFFTIDNVINFSTKTKEQQISILSHMHFATSDRLFNNIDNSHLFFSAIQLLNQALDLEISECQRLNFDYESKPIKDKFRHINSMIKINNIHFIKVDKPTHCFHLLYFASTEFFGNDHRFYQILFCNQKTDLRQYLDDFKHEKHLTKCIIFHPEFLNETNFNLLKEETRIKLSSISSERNTNILVISSSSFTTEKEYFTEFTLDEISFMRENSRKNKLEFRFQRFPAPPVCKDKQAVVYIDKENLQFSISKCFQSDYDSIYFRISPAMLEDAVTFWDQLFSSVFYSLADIDGDFQIFPLNCKSIIFEEPYENAIKDLNDFPFPIKNESILTTRNQNLSIFDSTDNDIKTYFQSIIGEYQKVNLTINPTDSLFDILTKFYPIFFPRSSLNKPISIFILEYIKQYLFAFARRLNTKMEKYKEQEKKSSFLLLILSALHIYGLAPKRGFSIMYFDSMMNPNQNSDSKIHFFTSYNKEYLLGFISPQIFNSDTIDIRTALNPINQIEAYKILGNCLNPDIVLELCKLKSMEVFNNFEKGQYKCREYEFMEYANKQKEAPNDDIALLQSLLISLHISSKNYDQLKMSFKSNLKKDDEPIINFTLSWPLLYRTIILLTRISLFQTTLLSGDTGCGKTSLVKMLKRVFDRFKTQLKSNFGPSLNIHGDVNRNKIDLFMKKTKRNEIIFMDEFNTTESVSYIENLLIENNQNNAFLAAMNPLIEANSISRVLSKIGMKQTIFNDPPPVTLLNNAQTKKDLNDYKYFVHKLYKTEDFIVDFNPMIIGDEESEFLPNEEKNLIQTIIESRAYQEKANYNPKNVISLFQNVLPDSVIWIRQFMKENGFISMRDIHAVFDFFIQYHISINPNIEDKTQIQRTAVLFAILSAFALCLPEKLEISENINEICEHASKFNIQIENSKILHVRKAFLSMIARNLNYKDADEVIELFTKYAYWSLWNTVIVDRNIWNFSSFLFHMVIINLTIKMQRACFIIGPPGTSKSFALDLLKGNPKQFFTTYMCSRDSSSEGLESQFLDTALIQLKNVGFAVILFEEIGLANVNKRLPLKYLHFEIDSGVKINDDPQYVKVSCIGVSNYAMDLANMNRGTLIYTDIYDIQEIITSFLSSEIQTNKIDEKTDYFFSDAFNNKYDSFRNSRKEIASDPKNGWVKLFFTSLWPEGTTPSSLALRSIYTLYQITRKIKNNDTEISCNVFCQIAREITNARRLIKQPKIGDQTIFTNESFKDVAIPTFDFILRMFPEKIKTLPKELISFPNNEKIIDFNEFKINADRTITFTTNGTKKVAYIQISNLDVLIDRFYSSKSHKSLCLLTENYSSLENIEMIFQEAMPTSIRLMHEIMNGTNKKQVIKKVQELQSYETELNFYFEKDFKKNPLEQNRESIKQFIDHLPKKENRSNKPERAIIVGNNSMLDSLLDLLNSNKINNDSESEDFDALISSDGFSLPFKVNKSFYLMLILDKDELIQKFGSIPLPLMDRLETIYIDWKSLKYLAYINLLKKSDKVQNEFLQSQATTFKLFVDQSDEIVSKFLHDNILSDIMVDSNPPFHSSLQNLVSQEISNLFVDEYLKKLRHWDKRRHCSIYTNSMLYDELHFPNTKSVFDDSISDESQFQALLNSFQSYDNNNNSRTTIIIKCSKFSAMHDQHLKKLLESITNDVFIIYYQIPTENLPTSLNWPGFWIEDISNYPIVVESQNSYNLRKIYNELLTNTNISMEAKNLLKPIYTDIFCHLYTVSDDAARKIKEQFDFLYDDEFNLFNLKFDNYVPTRQENSQYSLQICYYKHIKSLIKKQIYPFLCILFTHLYYRYSNNQSSSIPREQYYSALEFLHKTDPTILKNCMIDFENQNLDSASAQIDFYPIFKQSLNLVVNNSPDIYLEDEYCYKFIEAIRLSFPFYSQIGNKSKDNKKILQQYTSYMENTYIANSDYTKSLYHNLIYLFNEYYEPLNMVNFISEFSGISSDASHPPMKIYSIEHRFEDFFKNFKAIININIIELLTQIKEVTENCNIQNCLITSNEKSFNPSIFWQRYLITEIHPSKNSIKSIFAKKVDELLIYKYIDNATSADRDNPLSQFFITNGPNILPYFAKLFNIEPFIQPNEFSQLIISFPEAIINEQIMMPIEQLIISTILTQNGQLENNNLLNSLSSKDSQYFKNLHQNLKNKVISLNGNLKNLTWDEIKAKINNQKSFPDNQFIYAPDLGDKSLLEIMNIYMSDNEDHSSIQQFEKWILQDTGNYHLFAIQILLLFKSVHECHNGPITETVKAQLKMLISMSMPWKVITNDIIEQESLIILNIIDELLSTGNCQQINELVNNLNCNSTYKLIKRKSREGYSIESNQIKSVNLVFPSYSSLLLNYMIYSPKNEFPYIAHFVKFQKHRTFLNLAEKVLKTAFDYRKRCKGDARLLFLTLNYYSIDALNTDIKSDMKYFTDKHLENAYVQINYVFNEYIAIHNEFVSIFDNCPKIPIYNFIPDMMITKFDFRKFVTGTVLNEFLFSPSGTEINQSQDILAMNLNSLERKLKKMCSSQLFVFSEIEIKRYFYQNQPSPNLVTQNLDFLGMSDIDWSYLFEKISRNKFDAFASKLEPIPKGHYSSFFFSVLKYLYTFQPHLPQYTHVYIPEAFFKSPLYKSLPNDHQSRFREIANCL